MKESMYSYHYYKKRALLKRTRPADMIFRLALVSSALFFAVSLFKLIK